jgi:hypothetical protein
MDMRHEALRCAEAGLRVHPLYEVDDALVCQCWKGAGCDDKQRGKHPRLGGWQNVASADMQTVARWWDQWPRAGIGVATGRASRVWVLDLDGEEAISWYAEKGKQHGRTPTRGARTGRGRHLWWRWPDDEVEISNGQGQVGPGVDVRGDGGYVVAPPTLHRSGVRYEWLTTGAYVEAPQLAPAWLLELVKKKPKPPAPKMVDIPRRTPWSAKAADEELARRLRLDPYARQRLAEQIGAVVTDQHARKVKCPKCGDTSVWWMIHGTGFAKCSHLNSCGWLGPLTSLLG